MLVTAPGNVRRRSHSAPLSSKERTVAGRPPPAAGHGPRGRSAKHPRRELDETQKSEQPYPGSPMTMSVPKEPSTQMQTTAEKTVLITGANVGIGKDVARQLASRPETARIYLACRNQDRAATAKADLEAKPAGASSTSFSWTSPIWIRSAPAWPASTDPSTRW